MNVSIGCLGLGMIVLFFVTMIFLRQSDEHVAELEKELKDQMECINYLRKYARLISDDLDQTKETLNDLKEKLEDSEKSLDIASRLEGIEGSLKGMLDLMEQERTERLNARYEEEARQARALYEANLASAHSGDDDKPYADIPGDLDEGSEGEESATDEQREALEYAEKVIKSENDIPSYHWIFPQEDYGENRPVLGEEYLVIGRERKTGEIVSGTGTWAGLKYVMDDGYILDRVYADIRLPSPSDVMNKVLDIRFKEE